MFVSSLPCLEWLLVPNLQLKCASNVIVIQHFLANVGGQCFDERSLIETSFGDLATWTCHVVPVHGELESFDNLENPDSKSLSFERSDVILYVLLRISNYLM